MSSCHSLNEVVLDQVMQITKPHGRAIISLRNRVLEGLADFGTRLDLRKKE